MPLIFSSNRVGDEFQNVLTVCASWSLTHAELAAVYAEWRAKNPDASGHRQTVRLDDDQ